MIQWCLIVNCVISVYGIVYEMLNAIFQICSLTLEQLKINLLLDEKSFRLFFVIHRWIFGLATTLFNHSWYCRMVSVLKFGLQPTYLFVYTSRAGSSKSNYSYAQTHLGLQVLKLNGLIPLIYSFVKSKSILFDLNYAKDYLAANVYQR